MNDEIALLREIRDLLSLLAEPAIAVRDKKLRQSLRDKVGRSSKAKAAVRLMDGSLSQKEIAKKAGIDAGALSRLVKALRDDKLLSDDSTNPKLGIAIPGNFFESDEED